MNWAQRQRLIFIRDRIKQAGYINRCDIMEKFDVSAPQAALDFRLFRKHYPDEMVYDTKKKAYFRV